MPSVLAPTIIQGPAIVRHDGYSFYTTGGIRVTHSRQSFDVPSDMWGTIDTRLQSDMVEISFTPVGQLDSTAAMLNYLPFGPWDQVATSSVGSSIQNGTVSIHTKDGRLIVYPVGGIRKLPQLRLRPTQTLFGEMSIVCWGDVQVSNNRENADYMKSINSSAFSDATFDETAIKTGIYQASWGASPYAEMGSLNGFTVDFNLGTQEIMSEDVGIADIIITDIGVSASFVPNTLTEAQIATMMSIQNSGALYPGQSFTKSDNDLIISGDVLTLTINKAGPVNYEQQHQAGVHMHGGLTFATRKTFAVGTQAAMWTLSVN